ncbi:MAG: type II toxin-antitoxin system prevent-host-death family antitoxin [Acidimicrobiaceae bacterium]|nr:type II toxin-antitoxin system prevent-host-death family antitoxin [Acidimicrobiaceae bacterium]MYL08140.1 type II toxin-antitoxin system prevent-host-death family antitoxin [Acidimicrobiia bacterium]
MSSVSVSDLKARLSHYLREVRRGGEIQVLDRGKPVARLVPLAETGDEQRERLISSGLLRPGRGDPNAILDEAPLELPTSISEALEEDRADRL